MLEAFSKIEKEIDEKGGEFDFRYALVDFLERHEGVKMPYLKALEDAFDFAEGEYERIYRVGIFDWWRIEKQNRYTLEEEAKREQGDLEEELDYVIGGVLKRFNHFDFKTVDSDILGHVYEDYLPKVERKKLGEYYTPVEVVRYILDAVGYTPVVDDIEGKTILDLSCGSGTFLIEAAKRLIQKYLSKFRKNSVHKLEPEEASIILEGVRGCIYGLDINIFACHITEMNLFFQTIDLYGAVKSKYKGEVFRRFNVFHTDSLMPLGAKLGDYTNGRVKLFLNNIKDIAKIKGMKFDFVVGNPPYVRVQRLEKEQKEQYGKYYQTPKANYDIYILFIEREAKWLENNGKLGYITSDQFVLANYCEKLRKFIAENYKIEHFIDFADTGVFRDVTNYPSIIVFKKTDNEEEIKANFVKCVRVKQPKDNLLKNIQRNFYKKKYFNVSYDLFEFPQADLSNIWNFMPQKEERVFKKIEENTDCKFKEVSERIFQGLVSGADAVYIVKVTEEINDNLVKIKPIKPEREYIIEKEMKSDFPNAWQYLLGLLNSIVLEFYIKEINPLYSGRYYIYGRQYLEKVPIKLPRSTEEEDIAFETVSNVERILKQHRELRKLENRLSEFPDSYVDAELHPLFEVMESKEGLQKDSYSLSRLRIESLQNIEGKTMFNVLLTKEDYIAFKSESSAKFLFGVLKRRKRIIKNDLLRMQVHSDTDAEEIMKGYDGIEG